MIEVVTLEVLAAHHPGDAPLLLQRVCDLEPALAELAWAGLRIDSRVELSLGPCATFRPPGRAAARR